MLPLPTQPRQTTTSRSPASSDVIDGRQTQPAAVQDTAKSPSSKTRQRSVQTANANRKPHRRPHRNRPPTPQSQSDPSPGGTNFPRSNESSLAARDRCHVYPASDHWAQIQNADSARNRFPASSNRLRIFSTARINFSMCAYRTARGERSALWRICSGGPSAGSTRTASRSSRKSPSHTVTS